MTQSEGSVDTVSALLVAAGLSPDLLDLDRLADSYSGFRSRIDSLYSIGSDDLEPLFRPVPALMSRTPG